MTGDPVMTNELSRFKASFRRAPKVIRHGSTARLAITQLDHRVMRAYVAYRIDVPSMMLTATATVMDRPDGSGPVLHWIRVMEPAEQGGGFGLELLEWIVKVEGPLDALWCTESGIALATAYERRWGDQAWTKELFSRHKEKYPKWVFRMLAEHVAKHHECTRYPEGDDCRGSGDCLTEWCPYCYASWWMETHV